MRAVRLGTVVDGRAVRVRAMKVLVTSATGFMGAACARRWPAPATTGCTRSCSVASTPPASLPSVILQVSMCLQVACLSHLATSQSRISGFFLFVFLQKKMSELVLEPAGKKRMFGVPWKEELLADRVLLHALTSD